MSKDDDNIKGRMAQEGLVNLRKSGYYKEMCGLQKDMFDEYVSLGFTRVESLSLIMAISNIGKQL